MSENNEDKKDKTVEQVEASKAEEGESRKDTKEETSENNKEDGSKNEEVKLPSARLLLSVAQKENDYEIDRKKTFETRSAVLIAFTGVLITLLTKIMDSTYFKNVQPTEFVSYAIVFGLFFLSQYHFAYLTFFLQALSSLQRMLSSIHQKSLH